MTQEQSASLDEVVLGAFLEDIGKFMQRAMGSSRQLPPEVARRASDVLPSFRGRSTHWHALWTDAFFHELEKRGVALPAGINLGRVRDCAVYHHRPLTPLHYLSAEADRLSAGMDRKPRDEEAEANDGERDAFRRVALRSVFAAVDLGLGQPPSPAASRSYRVAPLAAEALQPAEVDGQAQKAAYVALWPDFLEGFITLCREARSPQLFHEGLLSLSERYTWAIPSSTIDQPDVPLHDHNKSVAAVAACLYRFHEARGELGDAEAIRDRRQAKYRFLLGDLSGIQSSLFRLASQQVKGAARILRARSFLMGSLVEAVSLAVRRKLELPPYCELLAAGGRFLLLVPDLAGTDEALEELRRDLDAWLLERYLGDLSFNLALGRPLSGEDLMQRRFGSALQAANDALAEAKLRPLSKVTTGVIEVEYDETPEGGCQACGVRPATRGEGSERRCQACHDAHRLGQRLPRAQALLFSHSPLPERVNGISVAVPHGLWLNLLTQEVRADDGDAWSRVLSGYRVATADIGFPALAVRHLASHLPLLQPGEDQDPRFQDLDEGSGEIQAGDTKTFAHLAAQSREFLGDGRIVGRPMLAMLKADVDRLGQIFSRGLGQDLSLGRLATLSRMTDAFFTIVLPDLVRRDHPNAYIVYAGGDDLLILGPWREILSLAEAVGRAFAAHVGGNPNVTLSAGLEFLRANEPLNRAVHRAEARLESAKDGGRNRLSLISARPLSWTQLKAALERAEQVSDWIRDPGRPLSTAFVYRTLGTARLRASAEAGDLRAANWRARWAYAIRSAFAGKAPEDQLRLQFFDRLLGSDLVTGASGDQALAEPALVIALYRNR